MGKGDQSTNNNPKECGQAPCRDTHGHPDESQPMSRFFGVYLQLSPRFLDANKTHKLRALFPLTAFKNTPNPKFVQNLSQRLFLGFQSGLKFVKHLSKFVRNCRFSNFDKVLTNFSPPDWNPQKQSLGQIWGSGCFLCCKGKKGSQHIKNFSIKTFGPQDPPKKILYVWAFSCILKRQEAPNIKNLRGQGSLGGGGSRRGVSGEILYVYAFFSRPEDS